MKFNIQKCRVSRKLRQLSSMGVAIKKSISGNSSIIREDFCSCQLPMKPARNLSFFLFVFMGHNVFNIFGFATLKQPFSHNIMYSS